MAAFSVEGKSCKKLEFWVINSVFTGLGKWNLNESFLYGTLCIVLLKSLKMGLYFSEIDTRG